MGVKVTESGLVEPFPPTFPATQLTPTFAQLLYTNNPDQVEVVCEVMVMEFVFVAVKV